MFQPFRCALLLSALLTVACGERGVSKLPEPEALPGPVSREVSYVDDVRPILEMKCLACHACFDAPCQLKMESAAGLLRGRHPLDAYDGTRTEAQTPTRVGIDAQTEAGWRGLGFHSVLTPDAEGESLLYKMLALGKSRPFAPNSKLPEDMDLGVTRDNQCVSQDGFAEYAHDRTLEGMPLAAAGLTDGEFALLSGWLMQGARVPDDVMRVSPAEQAVIDTWEAWLNHPDPERQLVARWLFEHLYLAHLHFSDLGDAPRFFEVLRSYTPPGEAIRPVTTALPNGDAQAPVHYRLRLLPGSIVHKRHIVFALNAALLKRIDTLFFGEDWSARKMPGYTAEARANPFTTFAAIPAQARYQFMLDQAEYFTRTFIRGPVCRGQIATDVIQDHFWVIYQAPQRDLFVTDTGYRERAAPLLGMPGQNDDLLDTGPAWDHFRDQRNDYHRLRRQAYADQRADGASLEDVWDGGGFNTNALLTVTRHHDSASVERGLIGQVPKTVWWMDYPLLERTYYQLVVNFDVFGNVAHQLQTRLYFDLIRNGAEHNYLRLLPRAARQGIVDDWYRGSGALKSHITYAPVDDQTPSAEGYATDAPLQELGLRLLERFHAINRMAVDPLNRCLSRPRARADQPQWIQQTDAQLARLAAVEAKDLPGVLKLPDVTFLRVSHTDGTRTVYSLIRNRAHSNVAFLLGESLRYEPEHDQVLVFPGILGSYPNFIFDVPAHQVAQFVERLGKADKGKAFDEIVELWGVRRTHPAFWETLHDFTAWQAEHQPLQAGVFDVNRYKNL